MERRDPPDFFDDLEEAAVIFQDFCETIDPADSEATLGISHFLKITELEIRMEQLERSKSQKDRDLVVNELARLHTEYARERIKPAYLRAYFSAQSQFETFMENVGELATIGPGIVIHRANTEFERAMMRHRAASPSQN